jgi:hypothetical protein
MQGMLAAVQFKICGVIISQLNLEIEKHKIISLLLVWF